MEQLSFLGGVAAPLSVTVITQHIRLILENDTILQDAWVQGEVSNASQPKSGHLYFTLKDAGAALRCVMWRNQVARQVYLPKDGDAVEVHGSVSVYEVGGQYQLYADSIRPVGEGLLYQEFLRLKAQLEAEGLFDEERKRPIPASPGVIGIVTSPTGAALRDMLNTLRRRFPLVEVVLAPASVQGEAAPGEIVAGIEALNRVVKPDVIIVGRGGGSIEDLWAFNDPNVARAIAASKVPVVSGVGHETDFTIADFVADLRAPTPTAAAELATPDQAEVRALLMERDQALGRAFSTVIENFRWELNAHDSRLQLYSPVNKIRSDRQRLDERIRRADRALIHQAAMLRSQLEGMTKRLDALSPQAVLARGYAVVSQPDGTVVRSPQQVSHGDKLNVEVADGRFGVEVSDLDVYDR